MKKSELRKIVQEEINTLNEAAVTVQDSTTAAILLAIKAVDYHSRAFPELQVTKSILNSAYKKHSKIFNNVDTGFVHKLVNKLFKVLQRG